MELVCTCKHDVTCTGAAHDDICPTVCGHYTRNRTLEEWDAVRDVFLSRNTREPETRVMNRHDMWVSMCHGSRKSVSLDGVWYYKTKRKPEARNTIYILWRGEHAVIIKRTMAELLFLYDHLPNVKYVLLTGSLPSTQNTTLGVCPV